MAYNTEELKQQAIELANKHKCVYIEELVSFLPCHKTTFYEHFPNESNDYKKIVEILENNRTQLKNAQRKKWFASDNAALQIAHYKLISSEEERKRLTSSYTEVGGRLDGAIEHKLPKGLKDVLERGFEEAIKQYRPEEGAEGTGEDQ